MLSTVTDSVVMPIADCAGRVNNLCTSRDDHSSLSIDRYSRAWAMECWVKGTRSSITGWPMEL
jgi:hypothetical protein